MLRKAFFSSYPLIWTVWHERLSLATAGVYQTTDGLSMMKSDSVSTDACPEVGLKKRRC